MTEVSPQQSPGWEEGAGDLSDRAPSNSAQGTRGRGSGSLPAGPPLHDQRIGGSWCLFSDPQFCSPLPPPSRRSRDPTHGPWAWLRASPSFQAPSGQAAAAVRLEPAACLSRPSFHCSSDPVFRAGGRSAPFVALCSVSASEALGFVLTGSSSPGCLRASLGGEGRWG